MVTRSMPVLGVICEYEYTSSRSRGVPILTRREESSTSSGVHSTRYIYIYIYTRVHDIYIYMDVNQSRESDSSLSVLCGTVPVHTRARSSQ